MIECLIRWIIFSVIIALMPLVFNVLRGVIKGQGIDIVQVFSEGELLLVSAAIAAGSLGQLFGGGSSHGVAKLISGGSCTIILMLTSLCFAYISGAKSSSEVLNMRAISYGSMIMLGFTVSASLCCVYFGNV